MSASTHPTVSTTIDIEQSSPPEPVSPQKLAVILYAAFAAIIAPLALMLTFYFGLMSEIEAARLSEPDVYMLVIPIAVAALFMAKFGALTLLVQRRWAGVGAAISGALVAVAYLAPTLQQERRITTLFGITVIANAILLILAQPFLDTSIKRLPPKELLKPSKIYKVGTVRYTFFGLCMVFIWLLWGDFVWTLFDTNMPNILVLQLKDMHASDTVNSFLNKTLAYAVTFLFAPAVSFRSDRHRSKYGRRIPFLLWSTPFVGLFLVLIGCYESLTTAVMGNTDKVAFLGMTLSRGTVSLLIFGLLFVAYDLANIFSNTLYWYLFNDVVPEKFLSQFLSFFRITGTLAGMFYSKWIFPVALDHFRFLFIVAGVCYVVGFVAMCYMVREGDYPPPPPLKDDPSKHRFGGPIGRWFDNLAAQIRTYSKECFTHRFYWFFFLQSTFYFVSGTSAMFAVVRNRDSLGLTMQQMGDLGFITLLVSMLLQWPAGWLSDRWNPIRVFIISTIIAFTQNVVQCLFLFTDFEPKTNLLILYWISFVLMPFGLLQNAAELPMYMRLLPKERYGQFCSANAMIRSFALIFGSFFTGFFLSRLEYMGDFRYRFYPVWAVVFQIPMVIFLVLLYRDWKARGGDKGYTPPEA